MVMSNIMDRFKDPETPQPVTGDEPDEAGEIVVFDRETGEVRFESRGEQAAKVPSD
jgi:hypothetical protein